MKISTQKIFCFLIILMLAEFGCSKQQYRARSKRYPHDVPQKDNPSKKSSGNKY